MLPLLGGCGRSLLACDSSDIRASVIERLSSDSNNALVAFAARQSSAVKARVDRAGSDAEKSAILAKAKQGASYHLAEAISMNSESRDRRAVTCSGVVAASVEDATAEKQVDFKVEQAMDGKVSVSVTPFQFTPESE